MPESGVSYPCSWRYDWRRTSHLDIEVAPTSKDQPIAVERIELIVSTTVVRATRLAKYFCYAM